MEKEGNEEKEDGMSFDFSKFKKKFKRDVSSGDDMTLNLSNVGSWLKNHKKVIIYVLLFSLLLFSAWLRFIPEEKYTGIYENSLSAMDPYWHYRHAGNVLDHGYVGDEIVCYNSLTKESIKNNGEACSNGFYLTYFDTMHNAPGGAPADQDFYAYFSAYSYKYIGKMFAPNFLTWHRWTPVFFGVLAVLGMFLLVKQFFGPIAGLASGFILCISPMFLTRTVTGFADTDAAVAFFTVFCFYFFVKAWDNTSLLYAVLGGITLGLFGIAWSAFKFVPFLMLCGVGFFFIYQLTLKFATGKKNVVNLVIEHFTLYWKKYLVFLLLLFIGLFIVATVIGIQRINFLSVVKTSTSLNVKEIYSVKTGDVVRNVYKTVAEMNPSNLREIFSRVHLAPVLLTLGFIVMLPFGLWKRLKEHLPHFILFSLWLAATLYMSLKATRFTIMLVLPVCIFAGISVAFAISQMKKKKPVISVIIALSLIILLFAVPNLPAVKGTQAGPSYYTTGKYTALQSGPSLGPNWFDFFKWAREETPKDAIFASWWDPGHAMTAVGERRSIADGSQHFGHVHDLAIAFTTTDETTALERLKKNEVSYFFTSTDLISKYGAISYLASGQGENYPMLRRSETKNTASGTVLIYPFGDMQVLVNLKEEGISATLRQGYNSQQIDRIFYYNQDQGYISDSNNENTIDAMLFLDPSFASAFFLPPQLENNMLTQLHLFNGQNLPHFEFVKNFGNEIKVFKVNYE